MGHQRQSAFQQRVVCFSGLMMLYGESGGEEGKLASTNQDLLYGYDYIFEVVTNRDLPSIKSHLPQIVEYRLMAILLLHIKLVIICLDKEQFGELADQLL